MSVTIGSENVVMIKIYSPRFMKAQRMGGNLRCNLIRMLIQKAFNELPSLCKLSQIQVMYPESKIKFDSIAKLRLSICY